MAIKFDKNRSVDSHWLKVPLRYCLNIHGANTPNKHKIIYGTPEQAYTNHVEWMKTEFPNEEVESYEEFLKEIEKYPDTLKVKEIPAGPNKEFAIIELYKKYAICAWRNSDTGNIGMQFTCPIQIHNGHLCIIYKDKPYRLD